MTATDRWDAWCLFPHWGEVDPDGVQIWVTYSQVATSLQIGRIRCSLAHSFHTGPSGSGGGPPPLSHELTPDFEHRQQRAAGIYWYITKQTCASLTPCTLQKTRILHQWEKKTSHHSLKQFLDTVQCSDSVDICRLTSIQYSVPRSHQSSMNECFEKKCALRCCPKTWNLFFVAEGHSDLQWAPGHIQASNGKKKRNEWMVGEVWSSLVR